MYYLLLILPLSECYRIRTSLLDMSDPSLSKMASNPMHSPILPDKHWYALFLPSERTSTHYYNRTFTQALVSFFALLYPLPSFQSQLFQYLSRIPATWKPINHATAVLLFASICNFYLIAAVLIVGVGKIVSYCYF